MPVNNIIEETSSAVEVDDEALNGDPVAEDKPLITAEEKSPVDVLWTCPICGEWFEDVPSVVEFKRPWPAGKFLIGSARRCPIDKKLLSDKPGRGYACDPWPGPAWLMRRRLDQDERAVAQYAVWNWRHSAWWEFVKAPKPVLFKDQPVYAAIVRSIIDEFGKRRVDPAFVRDVISVTRPSSKRFKGVVQPGFEIRSEVKDRKNSQYNPALLPPWNLSAVEINGVPIQPHRHGITGWIHSKQKPALDQDIDLRFIGRDVVKSRLHRDEVLELERDSGFRVLKIKGNTGGWRPLRADEDFLEWQKTDGLIDNQEVVDAANFEHEEPASIPLTEREVRRQLEKDYAADDRGVEWDGEEFTLTEDREYFPGQVFTRGRGRNKTDDERTEERAEWKKTQTHCEGILKAGLAWSHKDPLEDTRTLTLSDGTKVKVNLSNPICKLILIDIDIHRQNYDTKKELFGNDYERLRKKELMDINVVKETPTTKFTKAQVEYIKSKDGRAVFLHAVTDKPRWYLLDMDAHETYRDAIDAVMWTGIHSALEKDSMWNNPRASKAKHTKAVRDVVNRWQDYFRTPKIYILDLRNPSPMAAAILERGLDGPEPLTDLEALTQAIEALRERQEE